MAVESVSNLKYYLMGLKKWDAQNTREKFEIRTDFGLKHFNGREGLRHFRRGGMMVLH